MYADRLIRVVVEYALAYGEKKTIRRLSPIGYYEAEETISNDEEYIYINI